MERDSVNIKKDAFNISTKELNKKTDLTSADLSGGSNNAVETINELKRMVIELIENGKRS